MLKILKLSQWAFLLKMIFNPDVLKQAHELLFLVKQLQLTMKPFTLIIFLLLGEIFKNVLV